MIIYDNKVVVIIGTTLHSTVRIRLQGNVYITLLLPVTFTIIVIIISIQVDQKYKYSQRAQPRIENDILLFTLS